MRPRLPAWAAAIGLAIGCRGAPAPAPAPPRIEPADAGVDAPAAVVVAPTPKDELPDAVERIVQLYEAIAALPPDTGCDRIAAAIQAARAAHPGDRAVVRRARAERPAELESLWTTFQPRVAAAWPGLQRPQCPGDELELMEDP